MAVKVLRTSKQESPTKLKEVSKRVNGENSTWTRAESARIAFL